MEAVDQNPPHDLRAAISSEIGGDPSLAGTWSATSPTRVQPSAIEPALRDRIAPLIGLLGKVRRRSWLLVAGDRLAVGLAVWAIAFGIVAVLLRGAFVAAEESSWLAAVLGLSAVTVVWIAAHRHRWFRAALLVDEQAGGRDRVATAFELAAEGRDDPWARIQAAEAVLWGASVDPAVVVPARRPRYLGWALAGAAVALTGVFVPAAWLLAERDPGPKESVDVGLPVAIPDVQTVAELLGEDELELLRADRDLLDDVKAQLDDGETKAWIGKVRKVLDDVVNARIDKRDAMQKIAELQRQKPSASDPRDPSEAESKPNDSKSGAKTGQSEAEKADKQAAKDRAVRNSISRAMKNSLDSAPKGKEREELKKAVEKRDLDGIAKLVEKLANKDLTDKQLDKWIKFAEKFAKNLGDRKIPKRFDELKKRIQRLTQKRRRQGGLTSADRRRLSNARRNFQQLRRKHGDMEAAKYRLQRLQRQTKKAMNELRRQRDRRRLGRRDRKRAQDEARRQKKQRQQKFKRSMRRAAQQMRRMSQQQKQRQAQRVGQSRMRQLRESMGRAGRRTASRREFEKRARQRQQQAGRGGQKRKQAGQGRNRMKQANSARQSAAQKRAKARGQSGSGGQRKQRQRRYAYKLGDSDMPENPRMRMMREAGGRPGGKPGDGAGIDDGNDPKGGKSKRIGVGRTEKVKGIDNEGPTVKQVFLDAAKKGFARQSWRAVYADYSEVAESMIAKEGLPVGRRALVRRYFELIRPRTPATKP